MIRMMQSSSAAGAKHYFNLALEKEDYYSRDQQQEINGEWGGKGAERLGLSGPVGKDAFHQLTDNIHPETGERLTARTVPGRRVGYDISYSAVKSVSVLHALSDDESRAEIEQAFMAAMRDTMHDVEADMQTRVRVDGANFNRSTGNAVWAEFLHTTARPVDGLPDPNLHVHCFTFNCTYDAEEARWKAGQFGDIKRDMPYYQAQFQHRLASAMLELGYSVEHTETGWEIGGVSKDVIDTFSRRTQQIEREAELRGIQHDPDRKAELGGRTRDWKNHDSLDTLRDTWWSRLTDDQQRALRATSARELPGEGPDLSAEDAVRRAMETAFLEKASVSERRFIAEALKHGVGAVSEAQIRDAMQDAPLLVRETETGRMLATDDAALRQQAVARAILDGRGTQPQLMPDATTDAPEHYRSEIDHVLRSRDRVIYLPTRDPLIRDEVAASLERQQLRVVPVFTELGAHRAQMLEQTVNALLESPDDYALIGGEVIWFDNAADVPDAQLQQVVELAEQYDTRLVITGNFGDKYLLGELYPTEVQPGLQNPGQDTGEPSASPTPTEPMQEFAPEMEAPPVSYNVAPSEAEPAPEASPEIDGIDFE